VGVQALAALRVLSYFGRSSGAVVRLKWQSFRGRHSRLADGAKMVNCQWTGGLNYRNGNAGCNDSQIRLDRPSTPCTYSKVLFTSCISLVLRFATSLATVTSRQVRVLI